MAYKFNPFTGNLDDVGASAAAFEVLGTVATVGDLPGGATQGDVYLVEADDNFYVWDGSAWSSLGTLAGPQGPTGATGAVGPAGADGADGADGVGVDAGGTTGQVLAKASNTDYDTEWVDQTGGGGTPGGSDTQVQFNDGGAFGGDSGLTYDDTAGALTVGGKTATTDSPVLNLSQTWNNAATTFTGLKLNVTNTASAAGSNLLDLQVGGTRQVSIDAVGLVELAGSTVSGGISFGSKQYGFQSAFDWTFKNPNGWIGFAAQGGSADIKLSRDAANTLAQRNGTNAQTYRLYNTYTDASNYERTSITRDSSGLVIDAQKGGTGADPTNLLDVKLDGSSKFAIEPTGRFGSANVQIGVQSTYLEFIYSNTVRGIAGVDDGAAMFKLPNSGFFGWAPSATINATADIELRRDSAGVVKITSGSTGTGYIKQDPVAISALPDPTDATGVGAGTRGFVNDASSTTFAAEVAVGTNDGGSTVVPVYSDGTSWRIG